MIRRRARLSLLIAAVAAGVVVPAVGIAPGVAGAVATPGAAGPAVTLLTGDKVTFGGMRGVNVQPAQGREHLAFYVRTDEQGDTHVIPEDAVAPLSAGKLDARLFDVSELVRIGYDDASRERLPLIVDYPGRTPRMASAQVSRELPAMSAAAVSAERSADFWATARKSEHVWLDAPVRASLDRSVPQIGAPEAWAAGNTGAGTTVAVLDTGIDASHPDLADAVAGAQNFTDSDTADDRAGHGTHVASIITGNGAQYRGVAPDTKLLNGKVLNDAGDGQESWIIAGMEWAVASGADVVNMSLGTRYPTDGTDAMSQAVNRLTAETGALFVVAAGNTGGLVGSPGAADAALTVGAVDRDDALADFSSRGRFGGGLKPDITAPGVGIVAAKVGGGHMALSGTSMATPHVAGAAAILAAQHPDWQADQLKVALMGSAKPNGALTEQGAGRVDVAKASAATVFASLSTIDHGTVQWPHNDDEPIEKAVTYTNTGTEPVTLDFAADVPGAPQGMFTFTPSRLTVPAGGQATATVTTDTRVDAPDGDYLGTINATGGGQSVRTLITVTREPESYDMTLKLVDANGAPTDMYTYQFTDLRTSRSYGAYDPSGTVVLRLPKGEYFFAATVQTPAGDRYKQALFGEPAITVSGDTEYVADAREAKPVTFTVDKPNARAGDALFQIHGKTANGTTGTTAFIENFDNFAFRPSTTSKKDAFTFVAEARMAEWNGTSFDASPYLYNVRHTENGAIPQTLQWRYRDSQLAKVRSEHAAATPGMVGVRERFLLVPLPGTLTEYFTPDVPWDNRFDEASGPYQYPAVSSLEQIQPRTYKLGRTTTVRWNAGVYGPSFPDSTTARHGGWHWAVRIGRNLNFDLPLATDQGRGRMGFAAAEGTTTLLRDGEVLAESPYPGIGSFQVTLMPDVYTVRATADRSALARLSTQISAEWTFTTKYVTDDPVHLPLLALRFAPDLDGHNTAPAGCRFTIPVYVERNHAELGQVNTPSVEVSYDDGATWQPASVNRHHDQWKATVDHPADAQFVSLRSTVTDPAGNEQRQTIIRAYELR